MARTKVSSKFQVVIPREIREQVSLRKGEDLQVIAKGDVITLIPNRPLSSYRGFAKGVSTSRLRDKKDRV